MRWPQFRTPSLWANVTIGCVFGCGRAVGSIWDIDYIYDELHDKSWDHTESSRLQNLRDCTVVKVELCKTADASSGEEQGQGQGEFVLVTVHHPANADYPRVLRFERCVERTDPEAGDQFGVDPDACIFRDTVGYYGTVRDALQKRYQAPQAQKGYSCWTLTFKEAQNLTAVFKNVVVTFYFFCFLTPLDA